MSKNNKIAVSIYCVIALMLIITEIVQCVVYENQQVFSILLLAVTVVSSVVMVLSFKITSKTFVLLTDILVPILLFWGLAFEVASVVYNSDSLVLGIVNMVFILMLGALVVIKIVLEIVKVQKAINTPKKRRRELNQDEIIKTIEKLKDLCDKGILTEEEYEQHRKNYVEML